MLRQFSEKNSHPKVSNIQFRHLTLLFKDCKSSSDNRSRVQRIGCLRMLPQRICLLPHASIIHQFHALMQSRPIQLPISCYSYLLGSLSIFNNSKFVRTIAQRVFDIPLINLPNGPLCKHALVEMKRLLHSFDVHHKGMQPTTLPLLS